MPEINMKTDYDWEGRMRSGREGQKKKIHIHESRRKDFLCGESEPSGGEGGTRLLFLLSSFSIGVSRKQNASSSGLLPTEPSHQPSPSFLSFLFINPNNRNNLQGAAARIQ